MTSHDDTKVQLTINRMTQECYDNIPDKSSTEIYLVGKDPTSIAKIDLDAQGAIESEISSLSAQTLETFIQVGNDISALGVEIQEVSANMSKSIIRRWEPVAGLGFVAEEANSTIAMQKVGSASDVSLEYNIGDGWEDFIVGTTTVTLPNVGDECFIRAKTTNTGMGSSASDYNQFVMTGTIAASDSIMYLLKNDGDLDTISEQYCFNQLFFECSSLTTAPTLPATTLASRCYRGMFNGCSSLTQAPELPATTLASSCYRNMFNGCSSLTTAPELPATTLAQTCYGSMFSGCTSLTQAPELLATDLADGCYDQMFKGCTSLTTAPELPATTLASDCYQGMFFNCSSLNEIKIAYTGNFSGTGVPTRAFNNWVFGVSSTGTFYYDGSDTTTGNSAIPTGWDVQPLTPSQQGLTFTAEQANSTVAMTSYYGPSVSLEYTTDGNTWQDFIVGTTTVTLANVGDKMYLRAKTYNSSFASGGWSYNVFTITGKIAASGSIMYLLKNDGDLDTISGQCCFLCLFKDCTSLTKSPELPATTLASACYCSMFDGCTSLTKAPELPATTMEYQCYLKMFNGCSSLTTAPELPATTLESNCYDSMFKDCTSLTSAPELPATTLENGCYQSMFYGCSSLNEIKIGYTGNFSGSGVPTNAFSNWVTDVASSGTFYYNGSDTSRGSSAIPQGWTVQTF